MGKRPSIFVWDAVKGTSVASSHLLACGVGHNSQLERATALRCWQEAELGARLLTIGKMLPYEAGHKSYNAGERRRDLRRRPGTGRTRTRPWPVPARSC